jgi:hypothetical protein
VTELLGVGLAAVLLVVVTWMLLTRALREKYAVLWIAIGLVILVLSLFPGLLAAVSRGLGVQLPSNLIFALSITLLLGVALHLSWELTRAEEEIRRVAEEAAIARAAIDDLSDRIRSLENGGSADS